MKIKYKKYWRKTSLKQKNIGNLFLNEVLNANPKKFLEIGIFQGVTARNVCELLHKIHKDKFKYIGIDLFDQKSTYEDEVEPAFTFNNPLKNFYFKYIKRQNPYSEIAVNDLLMKFKENVKSSSLFISSYLMSLVLTILSFSSAASFLKFRFINLVLSSSLICSEYIDSTTLVGTFPFLNPFKSASF